MSDADNVVPLTPPPQEKLSTIQEKEITVRMFVKMHSLLADGLFPGKYSRALNDARVFVERLHAEAMRIWRSDPEYKPEMENQDGSDSQEAPARPAPEDAN